MSILSSSLKVVGLKYWINKMTQVEVLHFNQLLIGEIAEGTVSKFSLFNIGMSKEPWQLFDTR